LSYASQSPLYKTIFFNRDVPRCQVDLPGTPNAQAYIILTAPAMTRFPSTNPSNTSRSTN